PSGPRGLVLVHRPPASPLLDGLGERLACRLSCGGSLPAADDLQHMLGLSPSLRELLDIGHGRPPHGDLISVCRGQRSPSALSRLIRSMPARRAAVAFGVPSATNMTAICSAAT